MRNPDRIELVLDAIRAAWRAAPDQRIGQLLLNATRRDGLTDKHRLWSMECEAVATRLHSMALRAKGIPPTDTR